MFTHAKDPMICPACSHCGGFTRLVGIEPHPTRSAVEIHTFGCLNCEKMSAQETNRHEHATLQ